MKAPKAAIRGGAQGFRTVESDSVSKRKSKSKRKKKGNEKGKGKKNMEKIRKLPLAYAATRQQNYAPRL
ncbi:MAG: hypothetical protein Q8P67_16905 [archaeon]|nr:hypothetical protein [archaeon]